MRTILIAVLDAASQQDQHTLLNTLLPLVQTGSADGYQLQLCALPYAFKRSLVVLEQLITQHKPAVLLVLAQDAAQTQISMEKVALNSNHCLNPDQDNQTANDSLTAQHGPAAYFSNLPLTALVSTLQQQQVPVAFWGMSSRGAATRPKAQLSAASLVLLSVIRFPSLIVAIAAAHMAITTSKVAGTQPV